MVQRLSTSSSVTKHILSHHGALARSLPSQTRRRQSLGTSVCGRHCRGQAADLVLAQSTAVFLSSVSTLSASAMADRTSTPNVFLVTSISTGKGKATLLTLSTAYLCILSERLGSFHSMHAALSQQIPSPLSVPDPLRHSHHLKLPSSFRLQQLHLLLQGLYLFGTSNHTNSCQVVPETSCEEFFGLIQCELGRGVKQEEVTSRELRCEGLRSLLQNSNPLGCAFELTLEDDTVSAYQNLFDVLSPSSAAAQYIPTKQHRHPSSWTTSQTVADLSRDSQTENLLEVPVLSSRHSVRLRP